MALIASPILCITAALRALHVCAITMFDASALIVNAEYRLHAGWRPAGLPGTEVRIECVSIVGSWDRFTRRAWMLSRVSSTR